MTTKAVRSQLPPPQRGPFVVMAHLHAVDWTGNISATIVNNYNNNNNAIGGGVSRWRREGARVDRTGVIEKLAR